MTTVATSLCQMQGFRVVHDGSWPALALQAEGLDLAPQPGERLLVVADWRRLPELLALQARALAVGASLLVVGLEPGAVSLGPWVSAGTPCLGCLRQWLRLNLQEPQHWSAQTAPQAALKRHAQTALSPAQTSAWQALLDNALAAPEQFIGAQQRLDWATLHSHTHRFHTHPHCETHPLPPDSAQSSRWPLPLPPMPLAAGALRQANTKLSLAALRAQLLDRRTGVVKHLFHDLSSDLMPMVAAEMPMRGTTAMEIGYGRTESRSGSEFVALLETLERFCGHEPRRHATSERGSFEQLRARHGEAVVDPRDFVLHDAEHCARTSFELEPYSDALPFDWSWGWSLGRQQPVLVPQQLLHYRLGDTQSKPLNRFVYDTSSGCALGGSVAEASLYGLLEVLERDAYLTAWYGRIAPREIALADVSDARVQGLLSRSRAAGFEVHAFDMRLDIDLPLVWALIHDPRADAPVKSYCASAAHFDWAQALFSALVEVSTSMGVYQHTMPGQREAARRLFDDPHAVRKMHDHVLLYSLPETWPRLGFLFDGQGPQPLPAQPSLPSDIGAELTRRVQQTLAVARDVIVVNQTWRPMEQLGLHCVKVLAPGLTPVTFGHQHRRVDLARVNSARAARSLPPLPDLAALNADPHNFP
jgi:ribosomal protein S12 methylthiotransferase accessory factor